jgi:hypothetical protein
VNAALDLAGLPRLRAEERAVIIRELAGVSRLGRVGNAV